MSYAETRLATTGNEPAASSVPASGAPERDNKWPDGTRVMVRNKPKSWSEATIYTRLDAEYWRVQYPSGGTGMFKGGDIRVYDAERDAKRAGQPRRASDRTANGVAVVESHCLAGCDLDALSGSWIPPLACGPRRHIENAEAGDTDRLAGQEGIENGVYHGLHRLARRRLV